MKGRRSGRLTTERVPDASMKPEDVLRSIEIEATTKGLPIIGPIRGVFLDEVIREHHPTKILEVGALVGYSAIRMARLLEKGGHITCVELSPDFAKVAMFNIEKAGLADTVDVLVGDAKSVLHKLVGSLDMVFLDAVKGEYLGYLKSCERLLHPGSVVVADNVKSHAEEVADYLDYVRSSGKFRSTYREADSNYRHGARISEPDAVEISVML
jgi:predicted O-methyltransferase YrrM